MKSVFDQYVNYCKGNLSRALALPQSLRTKILFCVIGETYSRGSQGILPKLYEMSSSLAPECNEVKE